MAACYIADVHDKVLRFNGRCNYIDYSDPHHVVFMNMDSYGNTICLALIPHSEIRYILNTTDAVGDLVE